MVKTTAIEPIELDDNNICLKAVPPLPCDAYKQPQTERNNLMLPPHHCNKLKALSNNNGGYVRERVCFG